MKLPKVDWNAFYDERSGLIVGTLEKSFSWWHERGHQVLSKSWLGRVGSELEWGVERAAIAGVFLTGGLVSGSVLLVLLALFFVLWPVFNEVFAWAYSFTHFKDVVE